MNLICNQAVIKVPLGVYAVTQALQPLSLLPLAAHKKVIITFGSEKERPIAIIPMLH